MSGPCGSSSTVTKDTTAASTITGTVPELPTRSATSTTRLTGSLSAAADAAAMPAAIAGATPNPGSGASRAPVAGLAGQGHVGR